MKRYGIFANGLEEQTDGEWVRYEDVKELLDREQAMQEALTEVDVYIHQYHDEARLVIERFLGSFARKLEELKKR